MADDDTPVSWAQQLAEAGANFISALEMGGRSDDAQQVRGMLTGLAQIAKASELSESALKTFADLKTVLSARRP